MYIFRGSQGCQEDGGIQQEALDKLTSSHQQELLELKERHQRELEEAKKDVNVTEVSMDIIRCLCEVCEDKHSLYIIIAE